MNLDQRPDELPIIVEEPFEEEFEETPFSKWTLPICLFVATVFTTLWAGAYQVYNGPIGGPGDFLLEHPDLLGRGVPFASTLLLILMTMSAGIMCFPESIACPRPYLCSFLVLPISSVRLVRSFVCEDRS